MGGFLEWLGDNPWVGFTGVGVLLAVGELVSMDLVLLMLAVGAIAGAVAAGVGAPLVVALVVAGAVSAAMYTLARPPMLHRLHGGVPALDGVATLVGTQGYTLTVVDSRSGRIKLDGEVWSARTYDPDGHIEVDTPVSVVQIDGATAVVLPD